MRVASSIILAVAMLLVAVPSQAQTYDPRYPVCMKVVGGGFHGGGERIDCSFTSLPQCQATASGRAAWCEINPYGSLAQAPASAPGKTYRRARRAYQ